MLAPPWIPVPAPAYGGIEEVIRLLCAGLTARGHHVTLFAPPGSDSSVDPAACRRACEERFGVPAVVARYEDVYRPIMTHRPGRDSVLG